MHGWHKINLQTYFQITFLCWAQSISTKTRLVNTNFKIAVRYDQVTVFEIDKVYFNWKNLKSIRVAKIF